MYLGITLTDPQKKKDLCLFDECRTSTECIRCGSDERAFPSCHCVLLGLVFRLLCIIYPYIQFCALLLVLVVLLLLLRLLPSQLLLPLLIPQLFSFNSIEKVFPDGIHRIALDIRINNSGSTAARSTRHRLRDGNVAKSASHQLSHTHCLPNEPKDGATWYFHSLTSIQEIKSFASNHPESAHVQINVFRCDFLI